MTTIAQHGRSPDGCAHGWVSREKGRCVFCGARVAEPVPPMPMFEAEPGHLMSADGRSHQFWTR